jgi:hypothetical protein
MKRRINFVQVVAVVVVFLLLTTTFVSQSYSQGNVTPTLDPSIQAIVETSVAGTLQALGTPIAIPTLSPVDKAVAQTLTAIAPTPTPLGVGGIISRGPIEVELLDYSFRPDKHPEPAAIAFDLDMRNVGDAPVEIRFDSASLTGFDNTGMAYGEYVAVFLNYRRNLPPNVICLAQYSAETEKTFTLQPGENLTWNLFLNTVEAEGCAPEDHRTRVGFGVDWVEIEWSITYRIVGKNERGTIPLSWTMPRNN